MRYGPDESDEITQEYPEKRDTIPCPPPALRCEDTGSLLPLTFDLASPDLDDW